VHDVENVASFPWSRNLYLNILGYCLTGTFSAVQPFYG
jgi:hypothetical protein